MDKDVSMQLAQLKQRYGTVFLIGVTLAAGILMTAMVVRSQTPAVAVGPVWEYVTVTTSPPNGGAGGRAAICYSTPSGCRADVADNLMMAAAKLGEKGWELTSVTDVSGGIRDARVMDFKRLRSVLNRGDSLDGR
jgi:hypothetical protein